MQRHLIAPKLFYFCWFAAQSMYAPYIGLYYRAVGLDLAQIGLLVALPGLIQIIATPLWGIFADRLQIHRALLPLAVAGTLLPVLLIGRTASFETLPLLVAAFALFVAPISPLADSATLALLGPDRSRYGAQRVWGTVGWMLSALLAGALIGRMGIGITFPGYVALAALTVLVAVALPRATLPRVALRAGLGRLLRDKRWARLLACAFLIGCCNAVIQGFLSLYLQDLGASAQQISFGVVIGTVSELPVMALTPLALRRWGARPLLISAALILALRTAIYAVAPNVGWALAAQILHGPAFALLYTGGVDESGKLAPPGLEATAQSLFGTLSFGVSAAIANTIGGWLYRDFGYGALFSTASVVALLGGALLWISKGAREESAVLARDA